MSEPKDVQSKRRLGPGRAWILAFSLALPLAFARLRAMELAHEADSLGWWYTLYGSLCYALPVAAGAAGAVVLWRAIRSAVEE